MTTGMFGKDLKGNLCKVWNRMSPGTYFPPPVRAVGIPGSSGGTPLPGVPAAGDKVAQAVAAMALEPSTEAVFHDGSCGCRRRKGALDAAGRCRERCRARDRVIGLGVRKFFDPVPWDLVVKAAQASVTREQRWIVLCVRRRPAAPVVMPGGRTQARDKGTPQGPAVSPVLASLFMHYAFGTWLERELPAVTFERSADDAVVHRATERQAREVLTALEQRMAGAGPRPHPDKTRIVYRKDGKRRRPDCPETPFTFPGCTFRAGNAPNRDGTSMFTGFLPAVSKDALKRPSAEARSWRIRLRTATEPQDLAAWVSPVVTGWMNYHGRYYTTALNRLLKRINAYLLRWAQRKYKRLRPSRKALRWRTRLTQRQPNLFAH